MIKKLYANVIFHKSPPKIKQQKIFASDNYADSDDKIICFLMKAADMKGKKMLLNDVCSQLIVKIQFVSLIKTEYTFLFGRKVYKFCKSIWISLSYENLPRGLKSWRMKT